MTTTPTNEQVPSIDELLDAAATPAERQRLEQAYQAGRNDVWSEVSDPRFAILETVLRDFAANDPETQRVLEIARKRNAELDPNGEDEA